MIPRPGQLWVVRRGKARKKVVVEIVDIFRRHPYGWLRDKRRVCHWFEIYYRTHGTWANHGCRSASARKFLSIATPHAS